MKVSTALGGALLALSAPLGAQPPAPSPAVVAMRWIAELTRMTPPGQRMPGYGLFARQVDDEPGAYSAVGLAGQFIYVHPRTRTVIVKLSYYPPVEPEPILPETVAFFHAVTRAR